MQPLPNAGDANVFPIGAALIPACRAGLPALVFPDQDTLICDPVTEVQSNHLLVAVAAQNYGINSYRIRQPFDFAGRTGKIVFDVQGYEEGLLGWVSVEVTEDPIPDPSFAIFGNYEGGILPKNGLELQFDSTCGQNPPATVFSLGTLHVFQDYADTVSAPKDPGCPPVQKGKLNHFEVSVSQRRIEAWATPFSNDGVHFDPAVLLYGADVNLNFSRGYVHVTTHNHATLKYSTGKSLDAWVARWDNVGFDGPVISSWREYEVPDSLQSTTASNADPANPSGAAKTLGYVAPDISMGPSATLHFSAVNIDKVTHTRLAIAAWYPDDRSETSQSTLKYRFNGGAWQDRPLTPKELTLLTTGPTVTGIVGAPALRGAMGQMIDLDPSTVGLVAGDNTLEFVTTAIGQNYPPAVANVDLVLLTQ